MKTRAESGVGTYPDKGAKLRPGREGPQGGLVRVQGGHYIAVWDLHAKPQLQEPCPTSPPGPTFFPPTPHFGPHSPAAAGAPPGNGTF